MNEKLNVFVNKIRDAKSILIVGHKNPDGDSLCSVLAIARLIEINFNKTSVCIYDGSISDALDNVPCRSNVKYVTCLDVNTKFDLAIVVDYGTLVNIGGSIDFIKSANYVVEIDHHINKAPIADLCINDVNAAATGQIVYDIMNVAGWKYDMDVLNLLGVAILTDTGNFKFVKNGNVLRVMADLVDKNVQVGELIELLKNKPKKAIQTEARVASNAEFYYRGRLAVAVIGARDYKNIDGRGETVLGLLGQIKGVEYIALLKEQKEKQIGISFRSRKMPINQIAEKFGGGGHPCAAGAVVYDCLDAVKKQVIEIFKGG